MIESGRLSVDSDGLLTVTRQDAEGEPDEFLRLGHVERVMWCNLDDLGVLDQHEVLLAEWRRSSALASAERRWDREEFAATR